MSGERPGPSVFLTGFMGAGKSSVGQPLAEALGLPFHDLDLCLISEFGCSIADFFASHGEACFRVAEERVLRALPLPALVALGGGAITTAGVRSWLRQQGRSLFLEWPLPVLLERVAGDPTRPLALDRAGLVRRYEERLPLYRQADLIWHSQPPHRESIDEIVAWAVARLKS